MTPTQEVIQKAMEALEPFAREANRAEPELSNNTNLVLGDFKNYLKVGDLRRAREARALLSQVEVSRSEREAALEEAAGIVKKHGAGFGSAFIAELGIIQDKIRALAPPADKSGGSK